MNCPNCGTSNLDNASICVNCGKPLAAAAPHTYTPPPPARPAAASYGAPPPSGEVIKNYLVHSILLLCCCFPFGVVGLIYAAQVNSKLAAGDVEGARAASSKARMFFWVGLGLGIVVAIMSAIFFATAGATFIQGVRDGMENR